MSAEPINRFTSKALVEQLRERNSTITKAEAELAVSRVFDALTASLQNVGDQVRIAGFGTFKRKIRPGRTARNPRTGESFTTSDAEVISFKQPKAS